MPSLRQIRYFLTVADLGNVTQAAQRLYVAQPALSRQIALLEAELGFPLFLRGPRGVALTPPGQAYRDRIQRVEELVQDAGAEAIRLARGEGGTLRLLHSSSIAVTSFLPALQTLVAEHPGVQVNLDRVASEIQVSEIGEGRADLGLVRLPLLRRMPGVAVQALWQERLWVLLPPGHSLSNKPALSLAALAAERFVSAVHRERGGLARLVADLCLEAGFSPAPAAIISRKTSMVDLVAAGLGVAVLPEPLAQRAPSSCTAHPLSDPAACATVALLSPLSPTPLASRITDILRGLPSTPLVTPCPSNP